MSIPQENEAPYDPFPPSSYASPEGLLAVGGILSPDLLVKAYSRGIFPWYNEGEPVQWWTPDPRCVLYPANFKISKSLRKVLSSGKFRFTMNTAFPEVIAACANTSRKGQPGTWITAEIITAYTQLFSLGYVQSAEAWLGKKLVGGLYGVRLGNIFFGESMFSIESNASKFALANFIQAEDQKDLQLIDCQVESPHLLSIGASLIKRIEFEKELFQMVAIN